MAAQEKRRPLIRYAGSAAETSIGSKPIGSELSYKLYPERPACQAVRVSTRIPAALPALRQTVGLIAGSRSKNQCFDDIFGLGPAGYPIPGHAPTNPLQQTSEGTINEQSRWRR